MSAPFPRTTPERRRELASLLLHLQRRWTSFTAETERYERTYGRTDPARYLTRGASRRYRLAMWVLEQSR